MERKSLGEKMAMWGIGPLFGAGAAAHFLYGVLGRPFWASLLFPVNESVFEHLKLGAFPTLLYAWLGGAILKKKQGHINGWYKGQWTATCVCLTSILLLHYFYEGALGRHGPWGDVLIFFLSVILGQLAAARVIKSSEEKDRWAMVLMMLLVLLLAAGTFWPPELPLFEDPTAGA